MLLPGLFFPESEAVLLRVFSLPRPSLAAQRISVSPSSFLPYIFSLISSLVPSLAPPLDTLPFFQKAALLQPIRCGRIERICKGRVPSGTRGIHPICRCLVSVVLDASLKERVMASPSFIKSLEDLSEPAGDNPGFQFQKKCGCCVKATLSSEFFPFTQGVKGLFSKVFSKDAEPTQISKTRHGSRNTRKSLKHLRMRSRIVIPTAPNAKNTFAKNVGTTFATCASTAAPAMLGRPTMIPTLEPKRKNKSAPNAEPALRERSSALNAARR